MYKDLILIPSARRLLIISEPAEQYRRISAAKVKTLSGADTLNARELQELAGA